MSFKVGDRVELLKKDAGDKYCDHALNAHGTITCDLGSHVTDRWQIDIDDSKAYHYAKEHQIRLLVQKDKQAEEISMTTKYYRVVKDHPFWEKGAIIKKMTDDPLPERYHAISDVFMSTDKDGNEYDCDKTFEHSSLVETSDWFERVYPIGKLEKMTFGNKKQAQAAAAAMYKGGK